MMSVEWVDTIQLYYNLFPFKYRYDDGMSPPIWKNMVSPNIIIQVQYCTQLGVIHVSEKNHNVAYQALQMSSLIG